MERKLEIEILIAELKKQGQPKIEVRKEVMKRASEAIKTNILMSDRFFMSGREKPLVMVDFYDNVTKINVKAQAHEHFGEVSLYHPEKRVSGMKGFEMSWFSSHASKDEMRNLFYLEVVGYVANQVRVDGELIGLIQKYIEEIAIVNKEISKIEMDIMGLNSEKQRIEREELEKKIITEGGVEFITPYYAFIKEADTKIRRGRGRREIKKVMVNTQTEKTITLAYYGVDGNLIDTLRVPKDQAMNLLVGHYKVNEEKKEKELVK